MCKIDISRVTVSSSSRRPLLERIHEYWEMKEWLEGTSYKFIYNQQQLPVIVEIENEEDATAFKLKFEV